MSKSSKFRARHIDHSAVLTVELPMDEALELFTPEGERRWVPGWDPEYFFRSEGDAVDTAFRTRHGGEETLWMVLDNDPEEGTAGYARVTPGSRMGTVMIDVEPIDDTSCWVTVDYELTATSELGNEQLKLFDTKAFEAMVADWEGRIRRLLAD